MANFKLIIGGVVLAFVASTGVSNYNEKEERITKLSTEYGLSSLENKAFRSCNKQLKNFKLNISSKASTGSIPLDICACQSKTMVKVMKEDQYSGFKNVINYEASPNFNVRKKIPSMDVKQSHTPSGAFVTLHKSFKQCIHKTQRKLAQQINDIRKPKKNYKQICRRNDLNKVTIKFCNNLRSKGKI